MEARGAAVRGTDLSLARWERGRGQRDRSLPLKEDVEVGNEITWFLCIHITPYGRENEQRPDD